MRHRQARHFYPGRRATLSRIGVHITATAEATSTAWGVAGYLSTTTRKASTHVTADRRELVGSVHEWDTAFGIANLNSPTYHVEHVASLADVERWARAPHQAPTLELAARHVAGVCLRRGIEPVRLTGREVLTARSGFVGHVDGNAALGHRGHVDPGPDWPWDWYLGRVAYHMGRLPTEPAMLPEAVEDEDEMYAPTDVVDFVPWGKGQIKLQHDGGTRFEGGATWESPAPAPFYWALPEDQRYWNEDKFGRVGFTAIRLATDALGNVLRDAAGRPRGVTLLRRDGSTYTWLTG